MDAIGSAAFRHRLGLVPAARRLAVIVTVFAGIVAVLVVLVNAEMAIMASVRAYAEGESYWSKGQKDAVFHLRSYAASRDAADWKRFRAAIAVPLGDHRARVELAKRAPDLDAARAGLRAGRNHPEDIDDMIMLYRRFGGVSYMAHAIAAWSEADRYLWKLVHAGDRVHAKVLAGDTDFAPELRRVASLNRKLTPVEEAFSATLGTGARMLRRLLRLAIDGMALALVTVGMTISWLLLRRMQRGEERYHHLLETAGDAIFVVDAASGRIVDANRRAGDLIGVPVADLIGRAAERFMRCEDLAGQPPNVVEQPAHGHAVVSGIGLRRADGRSVPVEVTTSAAVVDGRPILQCIARDVTERERAAAAQRAATRTLERSFAEVQRARRQSEERAFALARQAVELDLARTAALESVRAKSEFVATMSHELRTPLNIVLGYVDILHDAGMGPVNDEQLDTLDRIRASALQLLELIDGTLAIGRLDAGRENELREAVDVRALCDEVSAAFAPLVPAGVTLRTRCDLGSRRPCLDRVKLKTIVRNLVGNALKFTDTGIVEIGARSEGHDVVLEVRDTGIGMRPEELPHIFDMFRQCDGSSTRRYGGVGLGLHIVKRFTDLLGGSVDVTSEPGAGTSFIVRLPDRSAGAPADSEGRRSGSEL
ncbi:MAG: ATP-binding protein [Myxococcales bacterium]|nr:ATP-binding protein [Myxococcales bacterium]